jgi:hypothetical protein
MDSTINYTFDEGNIDEVQMDVAESIYIPTPKPLALKDFERFWKSTNPELNTSISHMYGEPTGGTLYKIWFLINKICRVREDDVFLDWGMGAGKMIISKLFFSPYNNISSVGFEVDPHAFGIAKRNIQRMAVTDNKIFCGDSSEKTSLFWEALGCSIVMQYDGGTSPFISEYHQKLMHALFNARTIRAVFSTKMNRSLFVTYFQDREDIMRKWKVHQLGGLSFGKSSYKGYLWTLKA